MNKSQMAAFRFGKFAIPHSQVFLVSKLSYGLVNLKPIRPGHVLVVPKRNVPRFTDLSSDEVSDLFQQSQRIARVLERVYSAESLTISMQDGPEAGQTVPHVHVHVIPRHKGDFEHNDDIYSELQRGSGRGNAVSVDNDSRRPRSADEMAKEADVLRKQLEQNDARCSDLAQ